MYQILPELRLRRTFPAVYFVETNPPEKRLQVLIAEKELRELPDDILKTFKKSNIDCYMQKPSATLRNGTMENTVYSKIFVMQNF